MKINLLIVLVSLFSFSIASFAGPEEERTLIRNRIDNAKSIHEMLGVDADAEAPVIKAALARDAKRLAGSTNPADVAYASKLAQAAQIATHWGTQYKQLTELRSVPVDEGAAVKHLEMFGELARKLKDNMGKATVEDLKQAVLDRKETLRVAARERIPKAKTLLEVLGLPESATSSQIKAAAREQSALMHTDVHGASGEHDRTYFNTIQAAYEILKMPELLALYQNWADKRNYDADAHLKIFGWIHKDIVAGQVDAAALQPFHVMTAVSQYEVDAERTSRSQQSADLGREIVRERIARAQDIFDILGIDRSASPHRISKAFSESSAFFSRAGNAEDKVIHEILATAYEILTTPSLLARYEEMMAHSPHLKADQQIKTFEIMFGNLKNLGKKPHDATEADVHEAMGQRTWDEATLGNWRKAQYEAANPPPKPEPAAAEPGHGAADGARAADASSQDRTHASEQPGSTSESSSPGDGPRIAPGTESARRPGRFARCFSPWKIVVAASVAVVSVGIPSAVTDHSETAEKPKALPESAPKIAPKTAPVVKIEPVRTPTEKAADIAKKHFNDLKSKAAKAKVKKAPVLSDSQKAAFERARQERNRLLRDGK